MTRAPAASAATPRGAPAPQSTHTTLQAQQSADDWLTYQHDLTRSGRASGAYDPANLHQVWETLPLGEPVPRSSLPCGNVDPTGILSTPVIEPSTGVLYAVASVQPPQHELYALDPASGQTIFQAPSGGSGGNLPHFLAPAAGGGRVFYSRGRRIVALGR